MKQTRGNLDDFREVQSFDVVVGLEENLPQTTFAHRVVLGVELIEAVKRVAILELNKNIHLLNMKSTVNTIHAREGQNGRLLSCKE